MDFVRLFTNCKNGLFQILAPRREVVRGGGIDR